MSKPTGEEAAKILMDHLQVGIKRSSDEVAQYLATGESREFENPFTGETWHLGVDPARGGLRKLFEESGITQNSELESLLRQLLRDHAHLQIAGLFADLDGEGGLIEKVKLQLRVVDGEPLPDYLHEIFKVEG